MVTFSDVAYYLGGRTLYEDVNLHIRPDDQMGFVGPNGTGKSTLLRMLAGTLQPSKGKIQINKGVHIAFFSQDLLSYASPKSLREVALEGLERIRSLEKRIEQLLLGMEKACTESMLEELAQAQTQFELMGGYEAEAKTEQILEGIGFSTADLDKPFNTFSGGWRMRGLLAKILLSAPDLMLLDEPTNHLDIDSIQWLEDYLKSYPRAYIVVSHDRRFLDEVSKKTLEVDNQQLTLYAGNFSFYEKEKAERLAIAQQAYANQQRHIKDTERFIERFRSKATKAKQVQSRIKSLERLDRIDIASSTSKAPRFAFSTARRPGKVLLSLEGASKAFGELQLFSNAHAKLERGAKVALVGANGRGKSTLLNLLAGVIAPDTGTQSTGHQVDLGFYAQHQLESLHLDNDVFSELQAHAPTKTETEIRTLLGMFLFSRDDVFKKIKVLSGGERARVALAKTLVGQSNCLLLDEPTNHLDMQACDVLAKALAAYEGSYIVISHDRHFVSQVAQQVWYLEDGQVRVYPGDYPGFCQQKG